jgi:hypothetical protein
MPFPPSGGGQWIGLAAYAIWRTGCPVLQFRDKLRTEPIRVLDQLGPIGCHTVHSLFHRR